ncbi:MAG: biotin-dependent carboxyltransferase family protein [Desulfurispora sp.]|uniref:5-oxoprolinase subunit C family protein n=1 Tax=Desulfurispora sp. TaxID=3014275 RepID=UPI004048EF9B
MLKVLNGGIEAVVEDWPGRIGYLDNGMASSGAFDNVALGLGNLLVGNPPGEAGIEIAGGYFSAEFGIETVISITGSDMQPTINGQKVPMWQPLIVQKGDVLTFSHFGEWGFRSYLCVAGGVDVPLYLGSKSTCLFGSYGGYQGRKLQKDDLLQFGRPAQSLQQLASHRLKDAVIPQYSREWELRAMPGPNAAPDYLTREGMDYLYETSFKIQLSSNRSAYRLAEAKDLAFARPDGGVAGSHPSNVLDHAYAIRGALNICGNTPILLIADGPTLGGYMCALHVIYADLWKIGQGTPGRDYIKFAYCTQEEAIAARLAQQELLSEKSLQ